MQMPRGTVVEDASWINIVAIQERDSAFAPRFLGQESPPPYIHMSISGPFLATFLAGWTPQLSKGCPLGTVVGRQSLPCIALRPPDPESGEPCRHGNWLPPPISGGGGP